MDDDNNLLFSQRFLVSNKTEDSLMQLIFHKLYMVNIALIEHLLCTQTSEI